MRAKLKNCNGGEKISVLCLVFMGAHISKKKKKGGNGNRSVEFHYTIITSSKLCRASPLNLLGSGGWEVCKA